MAAKKGGRKSAKKGSARKKSSAKKSGAKKGGARRKTAKKGARKSSRKKPAPWRRLLSLWQPVTTGARDQREYRACASSMMRATSSSCPIPASAAARANSPERSR
jgi:hypothetical protein